MYQPSKGMIKFKRAVWTGFILIIALCSLYRWIGKEDQWIFLAIAVFFIMYAMDLSVYIFMEQGTKNEHITTFLIQVMQLIALIALYPLHLLPHIFLIVLILATLRVAYQAYKRAKL